jgi:hypothetical protein
MTSLNERLRNLASDGHAAFGIVATLIDGLISDLRRDSRFRDIPRCEIELLLADRRSDIERRLIEELRGRVHIDDVGDFE